eukprot:TRINITY_DN28354_c0_g1_i2.p2 TRINITY_DN28354_c0_g1~~TRINITY_DN28354_c0_g1_i2.p2  ORF type:complete len:201 (-),score=20.60 TRINITY_DN28354_c0_g1_i2:342-944(-)
MDNQRSAKLVLLGEMGAGKSSIAIRYVKGQFNDYQESTIGAAFMTKSVAELKIKFEIWDTAGQERYHSLAPMYYRNAAAAIVVYDVTQESSFKKAIDWINELQRQAKPDVVIALAGNKVDKVKADSTLRKVTIEEAQQYADENSLLFMETSARDNTNIMELFTAVAKKLPSQEGSQVPAQGGVTLEASQSSGSGNKSGCC